MNPSTVKVAVKWSKFFCHFYAPTVLAKNILPEYTCIYTHTHILPTAFQRNNREAPPGMPHLFYSPLKHFFPFLSFFLFFFFFFFYFYSHLHRAIPHITLPCFNNACTESFTYARFPSFLP